MSKNRFIALVALVMMLCLSFGRSLAAENPVRWSVSSSATNNEREYDIIFTAQIAATWHMYDLGPYDEYGPNPTTFTLNNSADFDRVGEIAEITAPKEKHDPTFDMKIGYYTGRAVFRQRIKLKASIAKVSGNIEWMVCDDKSCLPPDDKDFSIVVGNPEKTAPTPAKTPAKTTNNSTTAKPVSPQTESAKPTVLVDTTKTTEPVADTTQSTEPVADTTATKTTESADTTQTTEPTESVETLAPLTPPAEESGTSLWGIIIEAILWGFAALLTPCVFPMVPMTISYFMNNQGGAARGRFMAVIYGVFIIGLYTLPIAAIILITKLLGGDSVTVDIFNWLATHWLPNVIFFLVFMIFAASFFGAFDITMPSWLVNRSDNKASSGGLGGLFFMALTLVLVSFSCTGPIVGSVLIKSTSGELWTPIITMLAFSGAFALPFIFFGLFPTLLKGLPKSGGWLNSVKVVLGFVEVAFGLKFLSVADQTYHWGILDREIYLAIWIVVFSLLGLYLLGKLRFSHDSEVKSVGVTRLFLSIAVFSFVVYLIPGMFGAPLKGLSGYLPPIHTQDFRLTGGALGSRSNDKSAIKYSDFLSLPHDLEGFFDYNQAMEYARSTKKPLLVDFTGHGCVNCREMEAKVWSDPKVLKLLRDNYVIVALYSDDKKVLPQQDWVTTTNGKVLKSLGKINSYFAHKQFGINAQPYYMILDGSGRQIVPARSYDLNVDAFAEFLRKGVDEYNKSL